MAPPVQPATETRTWKRPRKWAIQMLECEPGKLIALKESEKHTCRAPGNTPVCMFVFLLTEVKWGCVTATADQEHPALAAATLSIPISFPDAEK